LTTNGFLARLGAASMIAALGTGGGSLPARADTMAPWYAPAATRAAQFADFHEDYRRSVVEFQPFRAELTGLGADGTPLRLIALNPYVNAWFVLETGEGRTLRQWHLENAAPELFTVSLGADGRSLTVESEAGTGHLHPRGRASWRKPAAPTCPIRRSATSGCSCATRARAAGPRARR